MKKLLSLVLILILLMSVVACSSGKTETSSFELNQNGVKVVLTYTHQGDKVLTQTSESIITYAESAIKDKDMAKAQLDAIAQQYKNVEGIDYSIEYGDKQTIEKIKVDFTKLDAEAFKKLPNSLSSGDISKGVSLKKSEELLLQNGFKKVEK